MSNSGGGPTLGDIATPLAAFEPNVLIAGLGALIWIWATVLVFWEPDLAVLLSAEWKWWYAPAGLVAVVALFLLGLGVEGLAGILETWISNRRGWLQRWYSDCRETPDWRQAQRWAWKSPEAAAEFGRRRFRILTARNSAFNALVGTLGWVIFFSVRRPSNWSVKAAAVLILGVLVTVLFAHVWKNACAALRRAAQDAGAIE